MSRRRRLNLAVVVQTAALAAVLLSVAVFTLVHRLGPGTGAALGAVAAVVAAVAAGTAGYVFLRLRGGPRDGEVTAAYLPVLTEEWTRLAERAERLPAGQDRSEPAGHLEAARRLLFDASAPLRTARGVTEATGHIAEARHHLAVLEALGRGEPRPRRGAPCFFDPAHGSVTARHRFNPEGGADRTVSACPGCLALLEAGEVPPSKRITVRGVPTDYWRAGPVSVPYVDGYWRERRFPDHELHGLRRAPDLVWDPSATDLPAHLDRETPDYPQ